MASRFRGEIEIELDKPRIWRINLLAMERIEQQLKQARPDINYDLWTSTMREWSVRDYALLIWAGLARGEPQLSQDDIMELMDGTDLARFKVELMRLQVAALPDEAKKNLIDQLDDVQRSLLGQAASSGS